MREAVDELINHVCDNPELVSATWSFFYPELVAFGSNETGSRKDGKEEFWKRAFVARDQGQQQSYLIAKLLQEVAAQGVAGFSSGYHATVPTPPLRPTVQAVFWKDYAGVDDRTKVIEKPMHEIVANLAARNPARARYAESYFFKPTKGNTIALGMKHTLDQLAKYEAQIQGGTLNETSVRIDLVEGRDFLDYERASENLAWTLAKSDVEANTLLVKLAKQKEDLRQKIAADECYAIPLSGGGLAYRGKNGELVDSKGVPLQGRDLAFAKSYDANSVLNQQRIAKCLVDHNVR